MAKYILVYELRGYPDEGGGTYTEEFGMEEQKIHQAIEELVKTHKDNVKIVYTGFLQVEFIKYYTRVEPKRV